MKKYEVTLTLSKKRIPVYADSYEETLAQVGDMLTGFTMIDTTEEDVETIVINSIDVPDALAEPGTNQMAEVTAAPSDMDRFYESLETLCLDCGYEEDEIEEELESISGFDDFEPLLHWDFRPVCAVELESSSDCFPYHCRNRLFGKQGYLLDTSMQYGISALSTVSESYELWLLEDMTLAVAFCCTMTVEDDDGYRESVTCRFPASGSYPELAGDFNALDFLLSIENQICEALHLD